MKQKTYLDKLMENEEFKEKFIDELEKIFIDEDYLIWKKQRAIDKNYSSLNEDYLKGYRDCWNGLRDNVAKLIKKK